MLLIPRLYQHEAARSPFDYYASGKTGNPIVAMPTGTGKSVVIAMFLENVFRMYANQKILVLTHVKELIQQNYMKLLALWPGAPAGINSAGLGKRDFHDKIVFAGIASVAKYAAQFGHVDLILIDECDLVSPNDETQYQQFIRNLKAINPSLKVIGFTATPWRLGQGMITEEGGIFTDICFDITSMEAFNRLIAEGYLCPLTPKRTKTVLDLDGVHMRGGEFIPGELQNAVNKSEITERALRESFEIAHDRKKWLIFASGVQHAEDISQMMQSFGMECPAVTERMSDSARRDLIGPNGDFRTGKVRAVVNNNVLTTGMDVPDIDYILVLRPTASSRLWVQMLGRGTRPLFAAGFDLNDTEQRLAAIQASGKLDCLVGDFAANTRRLGPINDPVIPNKKGKGGGEAPVRECPICEVYLHTSVKVCPKCGYKFPEITKLKQEASTEALIKGDLPVVEVIPISNITYQLYEKHDRPESVKVTYWCGPTSFTEYMCLQHEGYAALKARRWWRERATTDAPATSREALERITECKVPTHLRVWVNKKYPEIMAYCYDGTAFGKQVGDSVEPPTVDVRKPRPEWGATPTNQDLQDPDDDIPF